MNSERWESASGPNRPSSDTDADRDKLLEDVLRQTLDLGQGDDWLETMAELKQEYPQAQSGEVETLTRLVMRYMKRRFPQLPLQNDKVLTMAATIAQSLVEDPIARQRIDALWNQTN